MNYLKDFRAQLEKRNAALNRSAPDADKTLADLYLTIGDLVRANGSTSITEAVARALRA